jgi:hypothetical protein
MLTIGVTLADAALATRSVIAAKRSMTHACRSHEIAVRFFHELPTLHRTDMEEIQRSMKILAERIEAYTEY